jgi:hypothetical protein
MQKVGLIYTVLVLLAFPVAARAGEAPAESDLVGRWSGEPPMGGALEINVTKVENGKITATGRITSKSGGERPTVSGAVKGQKVTLETRFSGGKSKIVYRCELAKKDEMPCTTGAGKTTTFVRVKESGR